MIWWYNNHVIQPTCFVSTQWHSQSQWLCNYNGTPGLCPDKASWWFSIESAWPKMIWYPLPVILFLPIWIKGPTCLTFLYHRPTDQMNVERKAMFYWGYFDSNCLSLHFKWMEHDMKCKFRSFIPFPLYYRRRKYTKRSGSKLYVPINAAENIYTYIWLSFFCGTSPTNARNHHVACQWGGVSSESRPHRATTTQLEVQWAYSVHFVYLQWGTAVRWGCSVDSVTGCSKISDNDLYAHCTSSWVVHRCCNSA